MDEATRQALIAINAHFYRETAPDFARTRRRGWPGWDQLAQALPPREGALRVLDVGCGNARLAAHLQERVGALDYLGIDASQPLLDAACASAPAGCDFELRCVDFLSGAPDDALPAGAYDLVTLFGVLHHVPGETLRTQLVAALCERIAAGGRLALTTWRFGERERFAKRIAAWEDCAPGIDHAQLEPGDVLLRWGDGDAVRYCHFVSQDEIAQHRAAIESRGLGLALDFYADGEGGALNHYLIFERGDA